MKHFLLPIALAVLTFSVATPRAHALFGHVDAEKQRRQQVEQQVVHEQQANGQLNRYPEEALALPLPTPTARPHNWISQGDGTDLCWNCGAERRTPQNATRPAALSTANGKGRL